MSTTRLLNPATTAELMPAFEAFIAALVEQFQPRQVIWFGSRARGEGDGWSDFDVLVVMDKCEEPLGVAGRMYSALSPGFAVDIIVRDWTETMERIESGDWFLNDAYAEGKRLHG